MIVKALREGELHALLLQVRLKDNARAARLGVWPAAAHPADLELQLAVPTTVYHWLQAFQDLRWRGKPGRQIGSTHWQARLQADAHRDAVRSLGPAPATRVLDAAAPGRALMPHMVPLANLLFKPATEGAIRMRCRSSRREGLWNQRNAPCVQTSTTQAGQCWNTWRGRQCTLQPRWMTRRRPPTSCKGGHGGPHGTPRTASAPSPRRSTTQTVMRRHPERPRGPAVRPNKGPSSRGWPPWPSLRPRWERALRTPLPQRATGSPGCPSTPRGDADAGRLKTGGHGGRRPMAPLLKPAQRPRPARSVPPGHAPAVPGARGLYRQGAPHHRHATPGGGLCHHAPGNRDR